MQNRDIQQMRAEDKQYGEKLQNTKHQPVKKPKNQVNFARLSVEELMAMDEEDIRDMA
jgi:hypothetical protein